MRDAKAPATLGGNGKDHSAHGPDRVVPRYEATDVSARAMVRWAVGLVVFTALSMLAVFGYYAVLHGPIGRQRAARVVEQRLAPWLRLQSNPARDIRDYRSEQTRLMESYGWVDQRRGIVRMPVRRAEELVLERGLPQWQSASGSGGKK